MSEWLGKPKIEEEDIRRSQPNLAKYFPMLTRYFVEDQRMRIVLVLPPETEGRFREAVRKAYGFFGPSTINRAATEAIEEWIKKHI